MRSGRDAARDTRDVGPRNGRGKAEGKEAANGVKFAKIHFSSVDAIPRRQRPKSGVLPPARQPGLELVKH